ncbi:hypothetical protein DH2020_029173 [Rehmannia glutinosa]|uniref:Uncharacterized protein n=1 Tax=Rehmannia glutinosa TaxID=99300 RepID=A0ABR0VPB7_REHGL
MCNVVDGVEEARRAAMVEKGVTMASGLESEAERVAVKWEVGPTKDVVQAFMETLVDPRLASRVSVNDPPSIDAQKSVARQMRAVVLLYNYYHRKQKPELEFLDFVSFCKLALSLRPSLTSFMNLMNERESVELNVAEDRLSVTEKAVKDACDITMALDASKDVPTTEGCPISKIAVLLIDSKRENCLLQFGAVTEGVWSPFEKDLNESNINREILVQEKMGKKRKISNQKRTDDSKFLQLGFDVVKDITGIDSSDIVILETHVTYSLSKEKSAVQFYMMQYRKPFSTNQIVPLTFLVERKDLCLPSLNGYNARSITNSGEKELTRGKDLDHIHIDSSVMNVGTSDKIANEHSEFNKKKCKHSFGSKAASSVNIFHNTSEDENVTDESVKRRDALVSAKKDASRISLENLDDGNDKRETGQKIAKDFNATEKLNKRGDTAVDSAKNKGSRTRNENVSEKFNIRRGVADDVKGESIICSEIFDNDDYEYLKGSLSGTSKGLQSMIDLTKTCPKNGDTRKKLNSRISVYMRKNNSPAQHDSHGPKDGINLKVEMPDLLKSNDTLCIDEKVTADNGDMTIFCNQSGIAVTEDPRVQLEALHNIEEKNLLNSEDLQNAVSLLSRKRQELCSQICSMEDELALYEDYIQRIRDGGEVVLARQCIKSIVSGNNDLLMKNETQIQDKGHQPGEDHHCNPQSERDFNLSSKGCLECSPCEARESAAAQMIAMIRQRFE